MTAEKIITTTQEIDIDVIGITLLSAEEAEDVDKNTRCIDNYWWLRSPGIFSDHAAVVDDGGDILGDGSIVFVSIGVRPALIISNLGSYNLRIGDRFVLAGEQWIVISEYKALCSRIIAKTPFSADRGASNVNDYEKSGIKTRLNEWAAERCIEGLGQCGIWEPVITADVGETRRKAEVLVLKGEQG